MIRNMLIILLSIWCMSCSSHKYILFEHIGVTNKPISCVIITKENTLEKKFCELQEEYVAEAESFKYLEKYVLSNDTKLSDIGGFNSFGSFKVQSDGKKLYVIEGHQNAIKYLTRLITELNSNNNDTLANLIERNILIRLKGL